MQQETIIEGFLKKRGEKGFKTYLDIYWPTRWCVLTDSTLVYKVDKTGPERGIIMINDVFNIEDHDNEQCIFHLETPYRKYSFQCPSKDEYLQWIDALKTLIQRNQGLEDSEHDYASQMMKSIQNDSLTNFCLCYCSPVSIKEMKRFISIGIDIMHQILVCKDLPESKPEDIVGLIWLFTAKIAQISDGKELFTSGCLRIDDVDGKIFNYINSCKNSYPRISTHYPERLSETFYLNGSQRGLDLRNLKLPSQKHSVLYFRLGDGTTAIKIEEAGFPPIIDNNFVSWENLLETAIHTKNYLRTRLPQKQSHIKKVWSKADNAFIEFKVSGRREKVPDALKQKFKKVLDLLYEDFQDGDTENIKLELYNYGIIYGLSAMITIIESIIHPTTAVRMVFSIGDTNSSPPVKLDKTLSGSVLCQQEQPCHNSLEMSFLVINKMKEYSSDEVDKVSTPTSTKTAPELKTLSERY
eukprot:TRINITY_DN7864_c0_g1_i2.p1 TRINITY_DN7864_c0_g1~~TRINITY_DN7864_c0_g1_i2.p1  ORF type:complete len:468 (-),score=51.85 TRINITY_DN7864_c0_g1_i2:391-1794(-)